MAGSRRCASPCGFCLHGWDRLDPDALSGVGETWLRLVQELGGDVRRVGSQAPEVVSAWLRARGLPLEELELARWETVEMPR
jgi:hypothetical protein